MSGPACGHSVCSQCYIDTGDPRCVAGKGLAPFALDSMIVGTALAIRAHLPHVTLSEALTYADASTVQGKSFRSRNGFFGCGYDRDTLFVAFAHYFAEWGDETRNHVRGVRLGSGETIEKAEPEVKACYGAIVMGRNATWIAFERYERRCKRAGRHCPVWPGTRNVGSRGIRMWLASEGIEAAVDCYARDPSAYVNIPEVHS